MDLFKLLKSLNEASEVLLKLLLQIIIKTTYILIKSQNLKDSMIIKVIKTLKKKWKSLRKVENNNNNINNNNNRKKIRNRKTKKIDKR